MFDDDEDLETEAIYKCAKALKPLDKDAKLRVFRNLVDRFGLNEQEHTDTIQKSSNFNKTQSKNIDSHLLVEENVEDEENIEEENYNDFPSVKDAVIKGLNKTEPDLLLIIIFHVSNIGTKLFSREDMINSYRENDFYNESRRKSLSSNINSLIRKSFIKSVTDNQYSLLPMGVENAKDVLEGNSSSKTRKSSSSKRKSKPKTVKSE